MRRVAILGSGAVGEALANGFLKHGYEVMRGSRQPAKLHDWKAQAGPHASVGTFGDAARFGEIVVLAVKGTAAQAAVELCGAAQLAGKTVIDATNPIADAAPTNGVLPFFTGINDSLLEQLQREFPAVKFVKAFNSVGSAFMVNPDFAGGPATMFICGNDAAAKQAVRGIVEQFGWEAADMGQAEAARAIEPLCMLWCIPGLLRGEWSHAFKLVKPV
ncbi:MAG TPA: NAD(P)-binding domain-containing protein [Albitalea sp.]|nr:NAD(P)-binding domain-containing protein [Albitalea sp.]